MSFENWFRKHGTPYYIWNVLHFAWFKTYVLAHLELPHYWKRFCRTIRRRVAFAGKLWKFPYLCCLRVWFGCHRVWFGCHRMTFFIHRTCFGCWLALYKVRGHLRTKLKISYSCVHLLRNSGQCDAGLNGWRTVIFFLTLTLILITLWGYKQKNRFQHPNYEGEIISF